LSTRSDGARISSLEFDGASLIAAGVDILTISRRLGHANPKITLSVYGHLYGNTDDKAAQAVEQMFARIGTE
jgi:integrase